MSAPIYLDYNATTPVDPRVLEAMLPYLAGHYGNPSSDHVLGQRAKAALVSVMLADSACHAADHAVSGVLAAMGLTREVAAGAVRLSLGRFTTGSEIDAAATALIGARKPLTA